MMILFLCDYPKKRLCKWFICAGQLGDTRVTRTLNEPFISIIYSTVDPASSPSRIHVA